MSRDYETNLDDLLGDLRENGRILERIEKLLTANFVAMQTLLTVCSDIKTIMEEKTGINIKKIYRPPVKNIEEPADI